MQQFSDINVDQAGDFATVLMESEAQRLEESLRDVATELRSLVKEYRKVSINLSCTVILCQRQLIVILKTVQNYLRMDLDLDAKKEKTRKVMPQK